MSERAYPVSEVAARYLPPHWTDAERWLRRRLSRDEIPGFRLGREWMMTDSDIEAFISSRRNNIPSPADVPVPATSIRDGLSERSRRRLRSA